MTEKLKQINENFYRRMEEFKMRLTEREKKKYENLNLERAFYMFYLNGYNDNKDEEMTVEV